MDKKRLEQIKQGGAMMAIAGRLYKRELITDTEYRKLMEEIRKRYHPVISSPQGDSLTVKEKQATALRKEATK